MDTDEAKEVAWDLLNEHFQAKRQELLEQLKALDVWYEEQFALLNLP